MRVVVALAVLLAGCAIPSARPAPPGCEFPPAARLTFAGESTMGELGIPAPGEEREQVYAWITADPIAFPSTPEPHRAICAERADGSYERSAFPGALFRTLSP